MKIDDTILKVVKLTKIEIKEFFPIEISEEEIIDIADSQFRGASFGLKKGLSVKLPVIGRFLRLDKKFINERIAELKKYKEFYSEIEYEQAELEAKIEFIKRNKDRWKKERETKITVTELIKLPNITNSGKLIYDRLNQLVDKNGE